MRSRQCSGADGKQGTLVATSVIICFVNEEWCVDMRRVMGTWRRAAIVTRSELYVTVCLRICVSPSLYLYLSLLQLLGMSRYALWRTINSVIDMSPPELLYEVVLIDDGSDAPEMGEVG